MAHILLTFGCLFYNDHVLSLNLSFEWFLGYHPRKGYIRQKFVCFKQELRRQTAAVINYRAPFRKKWVK